MERLIGCVNWWMRRFYGHVHNLEAEMIESNELQLAQLQTMRRIEEHLADVEIPFAQLQTMRRIEDQLRRHEASLQRLEQLQTMRRTEDQSVEHF